jgi:threonine dehydratase
MADLDSPSPSPTVSLPGLEDCNAAAARILGAATRTPLLTFPALDAATGLRVFVKPECLQRTGSFKFRGAYNALSQIPTADRPKGVVASSSGNHAQGVAEAARLLGMPATIVMPTDAPAIKRARTEAMGARVVPYDRARDDRDALARQVAAETGATIVHPYENRNVIAGQGTIGLEIAADLAALGVAADRVAVPAGGGGLLAGITVAVTALMSGTKLIGVEPAGFDDHARSVAAGARVRNERLSGSLCDALLAPMPGELSFAINGPRVSAWAAVSDREALAAVAFAARELKLVVEPGGAVALAALLAGRVASRGETVVVVLSGGNIDPDVLTEALAPAPVPTAAA